MNNNNERIYINCTVTNSSENSILPIEFNEIYQQPLIASKVTDYYFAVIRFNINANIPLFIAPIQNHQSNPNLTTLLITMNYEGEDFSQYIEYVPENNYVASPPNSQPLGNQSLSNYYYIYSVRQFLRMVNNTFTSVFNLVKTSHPDIPHTEAPYFTYDSNSKLLSLVSPYEYTSSSLKVFFNNALYKYFQAFEYITVINATEKNYQLIIADNKDNWYSIPPNEITNPPAYLNTVEEYISTFTWIQLQGLLITTTSLSIASEIMSTPVSQRSQYTNNSMNILTNFEPIIACIGDVNSPMQYQPQIYRAINLMSDNPIQNFQFKCWWVDKQNNIYPAMMLPNSASSFKFAFIKKSSYLT